MRIAAGNLFTGVFDAKNALKKGQTLQCTHFGDGANNTINYKPLKFEGYYKYTPGETFQDRLGNPSGKNRRGRHLRRRVQEHRMPRATPSIWTEATCSPAVRL